MVEGSHESIILDDVFRRLTLWGVLEYLVALLHYSLFPVPVRSTGTRGNEEKIKRRVIQIAIPRLVEREVRASVPKHLDTFGWGDRELSATSIIASTAL